MEDCTIDAAEMHYTPLNKRIREAVASGARRIVLRNVLGQRFIGNGVRGDVAIEVHGVPGGDLGMFMSGPRIEVFGNAEHAPGNTMDAGEIVIHGSAGDAVAHSMRGGSVFVRDAIGYRGGIHMKQYREKRPVLVVGEYARAFLGEYMAGGTVLVLARHGGPAVAERGLGSGIHGGEIVLRGGVDPQYLGVGATAVPLTDADWERIAPLVRAYGARFEVDPAPLLVREEYTRIVPASARPFANKYTWE
jgi:glutamate synthase domain-containing protein 3